MADVNIGNVTATIRADATEFQRGIAAALASLQQFQQATQQQMGGVQQSSTRTAQAFQQLGQQITLLNQQAMSQTGFLGQMATGLDRVQEALARTATATRTAASGMSGWQQALQVAAGIGIATTIQGIVRSLANFATESVQLAAKMQDLQRSFVALEGSGQAANRTLDFLFQTAQRAGVGFTEVAEGFRRLEAGAKGTTLSTDDLKRAMEGIATGARVLGVGTAESQRAIVAWEQILTKGRLSSEELVRQLGNAIPGGLGIVARSLGVTTAQLRAMAEGGIIPATQAFVAFGEEMRRIGQSAGPIEGLSATFARLKNETVAWMTAIGEAIGSKLQPFLDKLAEISEALRSLLNIPTPGTTAPGAGPAQAAGPFTARTQFPIAPSGFTGLIQQEARRSAIDPGLLSQVIRTESGFNPNAQSPAGALGLGQLMLPTAQGLEMGVTRETLLEPERNLRLAAKYLADMLDRFRGFNDQVKLALAAYNAGPDRVETVLNAARRAGTPTTFEAIQGQLPRETQAYVGKVLDIGLPAAGAPGAAGGAAAAAMSPDAQARIVESWRKEIAESLEIAKNLRGQIDAIAQSGGNFGNILDRDIAQAAARLVDRFANLQQAFATMPQLASQLPQALREQVTEATKEAAIWQELLLTDTRRRDLLRQQVEQLEQLTIRRQAELVASRQGQQEAEQFSRLETARLQQARLADRPRIAGLTTQQQIAEYEQRLVALQNRANEFGAQLEQRRADLLRPQFEAELQRVETFMARPGQSLAQQAQANVLQQAEQMRAHLERAIEELARHPGLQDLQEKFQSALQGLGDAAAAQSQIAFERVISTARQQVFTLQSQLDQALTLSGRAGRSAPEQAQAQVLQQGVAAEAALRKAIEDVKQSLDIQQLAPNLRQQLEDALAGLPEGVQKQGRLAFEQMDNQIRERIAGMGDQLDQVRMKLSAAGLSPLQADLERLRREFQAMLDTLDKLESKLGDEYVRATPARQEEIKSLVDQLNAARARVPAARDEAIEERQLRPQREYIAQLERELDRAQTAALGPATLVSDPRLELQLRQMRQTKEGEERLQTPEGREQAAQLEAQIRAQTRLNYTAGLFVDVANSVGSAWSQALMNIATHTETVEQAFQHMVQSILMSISQMAAQEATKAFIGLGLNLLGAAAGGALMGGGVGAASAGPDVVPGMAAAGTFGDIGWLGGAMSGGGVGGGALPNFQHGGQVNRPTLALVGENRSNNPEYILNRHQMNQMMSSAMQRAPSAGGQAAGSPLTIINVGNAEEAARQRSQQESMGRQVVLNYVLQDLSTGESSKINRAMRTLQR